MDWACCFIQNSSKLATAAFLDRVLARFGAPAQVLIDQGREFLSAFEELCTKVLIDHRTASRDHSEADGLAERVVQTTERGRSNIQIKFKYAPYSLNVSS